MFRMISMCDILVPGGLPKIKSNYYHYEFDFFQIVNKSCFAVEATVNEFWMWYYKGRDASLWSHFGGLRVMWGVNRNVGNDDNVCQ